MGARGAVHGGRCLTQSHRSTSPARTGRCSPHFAGSDKRKWVFCRVTHRHVSQFSTPRLRGSRQLDGAALSGNAAPATFSWSGWTGRPWVDLFDKSSAMSEFAEFDWKAHMISREMFQELSYKREPVDKNISLQGLRNLIHQSRDFEFKNSMKQDDVTLLKFLYARKFNVPDALALLQNYYAYRKKNPQLFQHFSVDAADIRQALENGLPGVLNSRDRKGRCVLVINANNWDCSYGLASVYRALLFVLEYLVEDISNQANGFVVIVDWTEFSFRQSMHLKPGTLKLMIEGLQDCFPARFKGIHFIGQPWYVEAALTVIKPFLKDKTKDRIYVHGNNLSTLHDYVARDILPAEMGGEQPSHNPEVWLKKVTSAGTQ